MRKWITVIETSKEVTIQNAKLSQEWENGAVSEISSSRDEKIEKLTRDEDWDESV